MPNIKYDYGVFIGRFAPVHDGHVKVMMEALEQCDYLIVVIGSNNTALNSRTPFSAKDRESMIRIATNYDKRILITSVGDYPYDEAIWLAEVQHSVNTTIKENEKSLFVFYTNKGWKDYNNSIALAGMHKDETSYYLNSFVQWPNSIAVKADSYEGEILSATAIRNFIFNGELEYVKNINPLVLQWIKNDMNAHPEKWERLKSDWKYENQYSSIYGQGPFITTDALVVQAGHILLIERGGDYGANLWAMPGGFLNRNEKILQGCIRELREETKLKVPDKVLQGSLKDVRVYDDPFRSLRSRIITHCHKFVLNNVSSGLPEVMGADDAKKAKWVEISKLKEMQNDFFEDHYAMITNIL